MTDNRGEAEWPINRRRDRIDTSAARRADPGTEQSSVKETRIATRRRGINPIFIALGGLLLVLVLLWLFLGRGSSDQDRLATRSAAANSASSDPEKLCGSKQTYDLMKRTLFRRAAQVRGSDQGPFDRLSAYAVLRVENPVMESNDDASGRVNCSGSVSLDLPPGVAVSGGRRTLSSDVDYTIQPAADGSGNVLLLRNADGIITPLATLARVASPVAPAAQPVSGQQPLPPEQPSAREPAASAAPPAGPVAPTAPVTRPAPSVPSQAPASPARPAFDCSRATNSNERAVCSDPGLAALDRQMSVQYRGALADADPGERALLVQTGRRFIAYRNRCGSTACIIDAYHGRMQEVRDIVSGRWNP